MMQRAKRALDEHAKTRIEQIDDSEERRVAAIMRRLLWDRRSGHLCLYALSANVDGGPGTSTLDSANSSFMFSTAVAKSDSFVCPHSSAIALFNHMTCVSSAET